MTDKQNKAEPATSTKDKLKASWEYRSGKFVLRIVAALFFFSYLAATMPSAWAWAWASYYKNQPPSQIDALIEKHVNTSDQSKIMGWIQLRPAEERASIQEKLLAHSPVLDSYAFLIFSDWALEKRELQDAIFWNFMGRYRLRYDALRCGTPNAVENIKGLAELLSYDVFEKILTQHPGLVPVMIKRVLDYDANHPAENDPTGICNFIYNLEKGNFVMVRREEWPPVRHTLRAVTEYNLKMMAQSIPAEETSPALSLPEHSETGADTSNSDDNNPDSKGAE